MEKSARAVNKMDEKTKLPPFTIVESISTLSQRIDWGLKDSNVPETWKVTKGEGITCMVIDTGHPEHPDLKGNIKAGENFISNEPIEDQNGHQTHCTGIICGVDNDIGMVGVAPEAKCISVKALSKSGGGSYIGLAQALDYAIKTKPDLVSMSLGGPSPSPILEDKIKTLYNMNIPVICAAGNTGQGGVNWPAAFDDTIAVAAYDKYGNIASFSSRGDKVEWAAPGVNIYSTFLNKGYASLSGTSMACPFIAGVICLMLSKHKKQEKETGKNDCKTVKEIREHLLKYTDDKGVVGKDNDWGYGVIDVDRLIGGDKPDSKPQPEPKPEPEPPKPPDSTPPKPPPQDRPPETPEDSPTNPSDPPFWKRNIAWIILGVFILGALIAFLISFSATDDIPPPPYINPDGTIDWDKKLEEEGLN